VQYGPYPGNAQIKKTIIAALRLTASSLTYAQTDRDIDNDGQWDADLGGTDRDLDNDNQWDADQVALIGI
jgi:Ni/Co efflux regulator RcnB